MRQSITHSYTIPLRIYFMIGDKNVAEHVEQFAHLEQAYANRTK